MSSSIHNTPDRKLLPQLQKHKDYVKSQISRPLDIENKQNIKTSIIEFKDDNIDILLEEWNHLKTVSKAGEILSHAILLDMQDDLSDVISFLQRSSPKNKILEWITNRNNQNISTSEEIDINIRRLSVEPKDAYTWIDQGLNFLEIGDRDEMVKCIEEALFINKDSSFIVRNASRIFNLLGDNNRALQILKQSEYYKYDPNILSAEIAFSQLEARHSRGSLHGTKLLSDGKYSDLQYSELAGALATDEYMKGDLKKSEQLFDRSLIDPNINAYTQSLFYKQNPIPEEKINWYSDSNEIQYHRLSETNNFKDALKHSLLWIEDEPYSSRPYHSSAYLSGSVLGNYDNAAQIIKRLIKMEESLKNDIDKELDMGLRNDLAYYLLMDNKIEEATTYLGRLQEEVDKKTMHNRREHVAIATLGLFAYKTGNFDLGEKMYRTTIKEFNKLKNRHNVQSAFLNFFNEQILHIEDLAGLISLKRELDDLIPKNANNDILFRKERALIRFDERVKKIRI